MCLRCASALVVVRSVLHLAGVCLVVVQPFGVIDVQSICMHFAMAAHNLFVWT